MARSIQMRISPGATTIALVIVLQAIGVLTQQRGGTPQTDKVQPVNSGANRIA